MTLPVAIKPILPLPVFGLEPAPEPLFPDDEPNFVCSGPRMPDERWTDQKGHEITLWFVDLGRRQGVRVDWQRAGVPKAPFTFPGPGMAHDYVKAWKDKDTAALPPAA